MVSNNLEDDEALLGLPMFNWKLFAVVRCNRPRSLVHQWRLRRLWRLWRLWQRRLWRLWRFGIIFQVDCCYSWKDSFLLSNDLRLKPTWGRSTTFTLFLEAHKYFNRLQKNWTWSTISYFLWFKIRKTPFQLLTKKLERRKLTVVTC